MYRDGYIDETAYEKASSAVLEIKTCPSPGIRSHVTADIIELLNETLGTTQVYRGKLNVMTALDQELQEAATLAVQSLSDKYAQRQTNLSATPEAALVAIEPRTGAIRALVGGIDFFSSHFNRVTQSRRQMGSAFKPIVYATALENGFTAASILEDKPLSYKDGRGGFYKPRNFNRRFQGPISLRQAMEQSINTIPVQLTEQLGLDKIRQMASRLSITSKIDNNLTVAIGSASLSLLELATAYTAFSSAGIVSEPYIINQVTNYQDTTLIRRKAIKTKQALSPEVAYVMQSLLRGVVERGTATQLLDLPCQAAGKTGTTDRYTDATFVGMIPGLVIATWVGFDDNTSLGRGEGGSVAALPIWKYFAKRACAILDVSSTTPIVDQTPDNIVVKTIDQSSGKLATPLCKDTIDEIFVKGTEPTGYCPEESK